MQPQLCCRARSPFSTLLCNHLLRRRTLMPHTGGLAMHRRSRSLVKASEEKGLPADESSGPEYTEGGPAHEESSAHGPDNIQAQADDPEYGMGEAPPEAESEEAEERTEGPSSPLGNKDLDTGYSILLEEQPPSAASTDGTSTISSDDEDIKISAADVRRAVKAERRRGSLAGPRDGTWPGQLASQAVKAHGGVGISRHWARRLARDVGTLKGPGRISKFLSRARDFMRRLKVKMGLTLEQYREPLLLLVAVLWFSFSMSLLSSSRNQVSIFTPDKQAWIVLVAKDITRTCSEVILERLSSVFVNWNRSSVGFQIVSVLVSALPIVAVFAAMYRSITGCSWPQALLKMHSIVNRQPGANMVSEISLRAFLVINGAYFAGLFTFAVFLGIVSDEVKRSFRLIRVGNYPVRLQGHTLILNWSSDAVPLLRQLALGKRYSEEPFFHKPVVILTTHDKGAIDEEISERLKDHLELYTRQGNPVIPKDLDMVGAKYADTVIVLHPENMSSWQAAEASKAATAMALGITGSTRCQNVVFQVASSVKAEINYLKSLTDAASGALGSADAAGAALPTRWSIQHALGPRKYSSAGSSQQVLNMLSMPDRNFMDGFTCHASVQPGMLRVWMKILQQGPSSAKLRVIPLPSEGPGRSFQEVRRSFLDCVVMGFIRGEQIYLSPLDSQIMTEGDKLVVLSYIQVPRSRPGTQQLFTAASQAAAQRLAKPSSYTIAPRKVIVAGWKRSRLQDMIQCFAETTPEHSHITFILKHIPEEPSPPTRLGSCKFSYVQSESPTSLKTLQEAGIKTADTVVLTGLLGEVGPQLDADAIILSSMLQVQSAVVACGRLTAPHIVAKVYRSASRQVLQQYFSGSRVLEASNLSEQPTAVLEEKERLEREAYDKERLEREWTEKERLDRERVERDRLERDRMDKERMEKERMEKERQEKERVEKGRIEKERVEKERVEKERLKERVEVEKVAKPAAAVSEKDKPEKERVDKDKPDKERLDKERQDKERLEKERLDNWRAEKKSTRVNLDEVARDWRNKEWSAIWGTAHAVSGQVSAQVADSTKVVELLKQSQASATSAGADYAAPMPLPQASAEPAAGRPAPASSPNSGPGGKLGAGALSWFYGGGGGSSVPAPIVKTQASNSTAPPDVVAMVPPPQAKSESGAGKAVPAASPSGGPGSKATPTTGPSASLGGKAAPTPGPSQGSSSKGGSHGLPWFGGSNNVTAGPVNVKRGPPRITNPEVFMPDDISAALLAQVAAQPDVTAVIRRLLTTRDDVELYLRNPAALNIAAGETATFAEVNEAARRLQQTAFGYVTANGCIVMAPEASACHRFQEGDQIIVLAPDYQSRKK